MNKSKEIYKLHAEFCKTLSNPIRLEILNAIRDEEKTVGEITNSLGIRQSTVSQHLALLRLRGVVATRKEGLNVYYKIIDPKIIKACDLLREVLIKKLARSERLVSSL